MSLFVFIPSFLIFLYCLYTLVKDDYFFIRKNISPEQIIDISIITLLSGLFFSRILNLFFSPGASLNILISFFSFRANNFSLLGLILGGGLALYIIGRYKKIPLGRLFDFFVTAFVVSLPFGFLTSMLFFKDYLLLIYFLNVIVFSVFAFCFIKYLKSKSAVFLLFFPPIFLLDSLAIQFLNKNNFINIENVLLVVLIVIGMVVYFKNK